MRSNPPAAGREIEKGSGDAYLKFNLHIRSWLLRSKSTTCRVVRWSRNGRDARGRYSLSSPPGRISSPRKEHEDHLEESTLRRSCFPLFFLNFFPSHGKQRNSPAPSKVSTCIRFIAERDSRMSRRLRVKWTLPARRVLKLLPLCDIDHRLRTITVVRNLFDKQNDSLRRDTCMLFYSFLSLSWR